MKIRINTTVQGQHNGLLLLITSSLDKNYYPSSWGHKQPINQTYSWTLQGYQLYSICHLSTGKGTRCCTTYTHTQ